VAAETRSRPRPIVEIDAGAARAVDARVAERLVALETADIDVPLPPQRDVAAPLYFRIVPRPPASLEIQLWELGNPEGARSVSATGSTSLEARRIALAAAELARRFRERRVRELARRNVSEDASLTASDKAQGVPLYARLAWMAGVEAQFASKGFFVGPRVDAALRFRSGPRLSLGAAWLAGSVKRDGASESARWLELPLAASNAFALSSVTALDVGLLASVASVHVSGAGAEPALDTWSSRGGLFARFEATLGRSLSIAVGPEASFVLHPVEGALSGVFIGGAVSAALTP